jgi:hypothetical protein
VRISSNTLTSEEIGFNFGDFSKKASEIAAYLLAHATIGMIKINGQRCPILIGELPAGAKTVSDLGQVLSRLSCLGRRRLRVAYFLNC